ncbi:MAG: hypothetical protein MI810_07590 [Flavobacteriales bacterium]|nr:hypothetical protein [Flavobacteriales bacterium]
MRSIVLTLSLMMLPFLAEAQTGYYGAKHSVDIKADLVPSIRRKNKLVDGELHSPLRYMYLNYGLNYNFVVSRTLEISAGVEYSSGRGFEDNGRFTNGMGVWDLLTAPKVNHFTGKFELKYYRKGSLAPIGKYIGVSLQYGRAWVKSGEPIEYGTVVNETTESSFFVKKYALGESFSTTTDITTKSISTLTLQGKVGRVWPITQFMSVVTGMTFPVGHIFLTQSSVIPIPSVFVGNNPYTLEDNYNQEWDQYMMYSIKRFNGIGMELSVRFHM